MEHDTILITLSCGTDNPNRATRALHLATVAHKAGKKAMLFLLDEGVYIARKGIADQMRAATGDIAADLIHYLQEFEVPILVCTPCANTRQVREADLIAGARLATAMELIEQATQSAVISL